MHKVFFQKETKGGFVGFSASWFKHLSFNTQVEPTGCSPSGRRARFFGDRFSIVGPFDRKLRMLPSSVPLGLRTAASGESPDTAQNRPQKAAILCRLCPLENANPVLQRFVLSLFF